MMESRRRAVVVGTGLYAPEKVITNQDLNDRVKCDVSTFLKEKRNMLERRYMAANQATSDLIIPAAEQALQNAGISAEELDLVIVSTDTPDYISPPTSAVVQHRLGAKKAGIFDVNAACSGVITALDIANRYISSDRRMGHVLVCGAYGMSKYLDWKDFKVATLFGDGAGALVLRATEELDRGILVSRLFSDGQYHSTLGLYLGGTRKPITLEAVQRNEHLLHFEKEKFPPEFNLTHWTRLIRELFSELKVTSKDVAHFFFTQINYETIKLVLNNLGAPTEKAYTIMDRFGYTGNACIAMALADANAKGQLKRGDLLMFATSGGGISAAAMAMRWGS